MAVPDRARRVAVARLPTRHGEFDMIVYEAADLKEHVALAVGLVASEEPVLVRVHSECLTGDAFGSRRCDCGEQLEDSLEILQRAGRGVLLYLRQEGRGIGLTSKVQAYAFQEIGLDTVEANLIQGLPEDSRDYRIAAEMLHDLGVRRVRLLTNNPAKVEDLRRHGVEISERLPLRVLPNPSNIRYLRTKRDRMGHLLPALATAEDIREDTP
ncbi:MAG TPA: GTP cyclohydrolase II [Rubrobacteraceae bacterium]|nr:GTP cyclohydrolase II [Rubrobacteraceae bacterium]